MLAASGFASLSATVWTLRARFRWAGISRPSLFLSVVIIAPIGAYELSPFTAASPLPRGSRAFRRPADVRHIALMPREPIALFGNRRAVKNIGLLQVRRSNRRKWIAKAPPAAGRTLYSGLSLSKRRVPGIRIVGHGL